MAQARDMRRPASLISGEWVMSTKGQSAAAAPGRWRSFLLLLGRACAAASVATVFKVGRFALPGFVVTVIWIVLIILVIILLAWIVHLAGGGLFELRLGHFRLQIGVT